MTTLFVYGTLKRGGRSQEHLAGQEFLGEAQTLPKYRLYDCGWHPALVADARQGVAVRGELYRVDEATLARLDEYEGVPGLFIRAEIAVAGVPGPVVAYLYQGDCSRLEDCGDRWPKKTG
jgi:gamma-glutamylaminecyclotransferase